jgi:predicted GIY-YIG superfamily endonuclease
METFVYIIAASPDGPVKIGYSKQPETRLKQLQTGHSEELHLYHTLSFERERAKLIERMMHKTLSLSRRTGEWFAIKVEDAMAELEFARIRYEEDKTLRDWL